MSKRRNENGQMRREEVERLDDDDEDNDAESLAHGFTKASENEMKDRKILKVQRKIPAASSSEAATSNPFAALGNTFLVGKQATTVISQASATTSTSTSNTLSSAAPTYNDKMKKLNAEFASWVQEQVMDHPVAMWTAGVNDYIKHAQDIAKYKQNETSSSNIASSSSLGPKTDSISSFGMKEVTKPPTVIPTTSAENSNKATSATELAANKWLAFPESKFNTSTAKPFSFGAESSSSMPSNSSAAALPIMPTFTGFTANPIPSSAAASTAKPSLPAFQFGQSSGASSMPLPMFSLPTMGAPANTSTGMFNLPAPSLGFGTATGPMMGQLGQSNAGVGGEEEDGDDAGEPILEPEKALRNENDVDEIIFEATSKLMRYDKESKEWKDMSKGIFRITRNPETKKPRMLMRSITGKIMFNAGFFSAMTFEKVKGGVKFSAVTAADGSSDGELNLYIMKVKEAEVANAYEKLTATAKTV